jgi:osmotically-inducible protein OsmY
MLNGLLGATMVESGNQKGKVSFMHKPNNLVESDVREALEWDLPLDDTRIVVSAKDGVVTLSGAVSTYYDSVLAQEDAYGVGGVTAVNNELLVGGVGEAIADADIAADCMAALDRDRFVPKGAVSASVDGGWVTLAGEVRHHFQRQAAEHAINRIDGVLGITNKIAITSDPIPSDVVSRINKALRRSAIVDDSLINVSNSGHTIYLDGTTASFAAKRQAEDAAWDAPGVSDVVDRLVVVP